MGYRSHGYIVFPEVFLTYWEQVCPQTPLDDFDDITKEGGYVTLTYMGWKWYESYGGVQEMEAFMHQIDDWADQNMHMILQGDTYTREELESGEYPWVLDLKLHHGPNGTINNFGVATYDSRPWYWAFNQQGEEVDDYTHRGNTDMGLYQDRRVDNPWQLEEGYAWQVGLPLTLDEKDQKIIGNALESLDVTYSDYDWDEVRPYNAKYPPYRTLTAAFRDGDPKVIPYFSAPMHGVSDKLVGFERTENLTQSENPDPDDFAQLPQAIIDKINAVDTNSELGELTGRAHWNNMDIYYELGDIADMDIWRSANAISDGYLGVEDIRDTWAGGYEYTDNPEVLGIDNYKSWWRGG